MLIPKPSYATTTRLRSIYVVILCTVSVSHSVSASLTQAQYYKKLYVFGRLVSTMVTIQLVIQSDFVWAKFMKPISDLLLAVSLPVNKLELVPFLIVFAILTASVVGTTMMVAHVSYSLYKGSMTHHWPAKLLRTAFGTIGVFKDPLLTVFVAMMDCDFFHKLKGSRQTGLGSNLNWDFECGDAPWHKFMFVLSCLVAVVFGILALFQSIMHASDPKSAMILSRAHSRLDLLDLTCNMLLTLGFYFFRFYPSLLAFSYLLSQATLTIMYAIFQPFYHRWVNDFFTGLSASTVWAGISFLIIVDGMEHASASSSTTSSFSSMNQESVASMAGSYLFIVGVVPFSALGYLLSRNIRRSIINRELSKYDGRNPNPVVDEFLFRRLADTYDRNVTVSFVYSLKAALVEVRTRFLQWDTSPRALNVAEDILKKGLLMYPQSVYLRLHYITFLLSYRKNIDLAQLRFGEIKSLHIDFDLQFSVLRRRRDMERLRQATHLGKDIAGMDTISYEELKKKVFEASAHHWRAITLMRQIWGVLAKSSKVHRDNKKRGVGHNKKSRKSRRGAKGAGKVTMSPVHAGLEQSNNNGNGNGKIDVIVSSMKKGSSWPGRGRREGNDNTNNVESDIEAGGWGDGSNDIVDAKKAQMERRENQAARLQGIQEMIPYLEQLQKVEAAADKTYAYLLQRCKDSTDMLSDYALYLRNVKRSTQDAMIIEERRDALIASREENEQRRQRQLAMRQSDNTSSDSDLSDEDDHEADKFGSRNRTNGKGGKLLDGQSSYRGGNDNGLQSDDERSGASSSSEESSYASSLGATSQQFRSVLMTKESSRVRALKLRLRLVTLAILACMSTMFVMFLIYNARVTDEFMAINESGIRRYLSVQSIIGMRAMHMAALANDTTTFGVLSEGLLGAMDKMELFHNRIVHEQPVGYSRVARFYSDPGAVVMESQLDGSVHAVGITVDDALRRIVAHGRTVARTSISHFTTIDKSSPNSFREFHWIMMNALDVMQLMDSATTLHQLAAMDSLWELQAILAALCSLGVLFECMAVMLIFRPTVHGMFSRFSTSTLRFVTVSRESLAVQLSRIEALRTQMAETRRNANDQNLENFDTLTTGVKKRAGGASQPTTPREAFTLVTHVQERSPINTNGNNSSIPSMRVPILPTGMADTQRMALMTHESDRVDSNDDDAEIGPITAETLSSNLGSDIEVMPSPRLGLKTSRRSNIRMSHVQSMELPGTAQQQQEQQQSARSRSPSTEEHAVMSSPRKVSFSEHGTSVSNFDSLDLVDSTKENITMAGESRWNGSHGGNANGNGNGNGNANGNGNGNANANGNARQPPSAAGSVEGLFMSELIAEDEAEVQANTAKSFQQLSYEQQQQLPQRSDSYGSQSASEATTRSYTATSVIHGTSTPSNIIHGTSMPSNIIAPRLVNLDTINDDEEAQSVDDLDDGIDNDHTIGAAASDNKKTEAAEPASDHTGLRSEKRKSALVVTYWLCLAFISASLIAFFLLALLSSIQTGKSSAELNNAGRRRFSTHGAVMFARELMLCSSNHAASLCGGTIPIVANSTYIREMMGGFTVASMQAHLGLLFGGQAGFVDQPVKRNIDVPDRKSEGNPFTHDKELMSKSKKMTGSLGRYIHHDNLYFKKTCYSDLDLDSAAPVLRIPRIMPLTARFNGNEEGCPLYHENDPIIVGGIHSTIDQLWTHFFQLKGAADAQLSLTQSNWLIIEQYLLSSDEVQFGLDKSVILYLNEAIERIEFQQTVLSVVFAFLSSIVVVQTVWLGSRIEVLMKENLDMSLIMERLLDDARKTEPLATKNMLLANE